MLDAIRFVLNCVVDLGKMLFDINIGSGLNLGLLMCIIFIFLPIVHRVICFIKQDAIDELNASYDEHKPRETWYFSEDQHYNPTTGSASCSYNSSHSRSRTRRYKV